MGQAFDRDGNVLGEATGATKDEVLKELERLAPNAHEVRIRSMEERLSGGVQQAKPTDPMLQFFAYDHLPQQLRAVSEPFCHLATLVVETLPRNPERTVALRKLLEAKDCAVRAVLYKAE